MVTAVVHAYLSGPIIHTESRKEDFYQTVVEFLERKGHSVFAPQFLHSTDPVEIYRRDVHQVRISDFLIGEVSNPSLGVGMEIMLAIELRKPVILFRTKDANRLSRMVLGAEGKALFEYELSVDVNKILNNFNLESLVVLSCDSCSSEIAHDRDGAHECIECGSVISE